MRRIVIFITLVASGTAFSNNVKPEFTELSVDEGLPGSNITSIYQDKTGYMWIGIEAAGLCKYDGRQFVIYENSEQNPYSISNNFVSDIVSDAYDNMWIATENALNFFDRKDGKFYKITPPDEPGSDLNNNWIVSVFVDADGNLWYGHKLGAYVIKEHFLKELNKYSGNSEMINQTVGEIKFQKYFNDTERNRSEVRNFYQQSNGIMWICCENGLIRYDPESTETKRYSSNGKPNSLVYDFVHFVREIDEDRMLVGTDRGINIFYHKTDKFETLKFPGIFNGEIDLKGFYDAEIDESGRIWLGLSEGILLGTPVNGTYEYTIISEGERELTSKIIRDIYIDQSGLVWIGTKFGGLMIHNIDKQVFKHILPDARGFDEFNPFDNYILSIYEDRDKEVWIGTKYSGILKYNVHKNAITKPFVIHNDEVKAFCSRVECIYQLQNGRIIAGNPRGVSVYEKNRGWIKYIPFKRINCFYVDSRNNTWVGSVNGLYLLDETRLDFFSYEEQNNNQLFADKNLHIYRIIEDDQHNLWVGTRDNGLFRYNLKSGIIKHYVFEKNNPNSLSGDMVRDIIQDKNGRIWIATKHAGICYSTNNDSFIRMNKSDGLPSNTVYSMLEDSHNNIWLGTHYGLSKLDIKHNKFTNFDKRHGLQSNIFENDAKLMTSDGYMLFGGKNGYNVFIPDSVKINIYKAPLIMSTFKVNERSIMSEFQRDTSVVLDHDQNYISFEFVMLDYRNPSKASYKYKLDGVDKNWIESGARNYISYPKLSNGEYTFRVKALNQDNNWEDTITVNIRIKPPIWRTGYAIIIYLIFVGILSYLLYYLANMRFNYVNSINDAKNQVQRSMELNRIKLHFFTNISHELRTPLSLIMAPLENLKISDDLSYKDRKNVQLLDANTRRLYNLINQLLYFRKTEQTNADMKVYETDIVSFIQEVTIPYNELAAKKNIDLSIKNNPKITLWIDPDKMEKIISNVLMNALKFTPEGGKVEIYFSTALLNTTGNKKRHANEKNSREAIKISVTDNGAGMPAEQMKFIFNRFYVGDNHKKGIGVGLELTRTLVELHGGKVTVESEQGRGSTFNLWFILGNTHFQKDMISDKKIDAQDYIAEIDHDVFLYDIMPGSQDVKEEEKPEKSDTKPLILVIDDNKDLRYFLSLNLSDEFRVMTASDGYEGLNMAKENVPELILSDVMMPEMDGIELCSYLKSDIATSHIPVILLTAKTLMENKLEGMSIGADDYIEKPFNFQFLQLRIRNLLRSRSKLREKILENLSTGAPQDEELKLSEYDRKFLENCKQAIEQNYADSKFGVVELSKFVGMSRSQLHRKLKALTGNSPIEWIYNYRLNRANEMLEDKKYNVSDVAYLTGFNSPSSFSTVFRKKFGLSPSEVLEK